MQNDVSPLTIYAAIAQLVERFHGKEEVSGSNPDRGSKSEMLQKLPPDWAVFWFRAAQTKEKTALSGDNFVISSNLERFYTFARTYFTAGEPKTPPLWQPKDNLWNTRAAHKRGKRKPKPKR